MGAILSPLTVITCKAPDFQTDLVDRSQMVGTARSIGSQGSGSSRHSNTNGGYRVVAKNSQVDEALFGTGSRTGSRAGNTIGRSSLNALTKGSSNAGTGPIPTDAVVVSAKDLTRLKTSVLAGASTEDAAKLAEKKAAQARAEERKQRILQLEEERKKNVELSDMQQEKVQKDTGLLSKAKMQLVEEKDEVKNMNQMMLYAKVMTIRDKQVEEKKRMEQEKEEEDRRLDQMMEVERLKAIQMYDEREKKRAEEQKQGAVVIKEQIKIREQQRLLELELLDQEREALQKQIEAMKEEEIMANEERHKTAARMAAEVKKANEDQIRRKALLVEAEREEERRIAEYIANKEAREAELQAEQDRVQAEKELETAKMRAQQEKASDKQAERDALRARRATEAYERDYREKERKAAEKQSNINKDLKRAREMQKQEKERRLAEQARAERINFERIIAVQREVEAAEKDKVEREAAYRREHSDDVRMQIAQKEAERRKQRMDKFEEGRRLEIALAQERTTVEAVKNKKMEELARAGVPAKYMSDLNKMKMKNL